MEEQRHLASINSQMPLDHVRSSEPQRGAAWHLRKGLGRIQERFLPGGLVPGGALPSIRCLAGELCAQRGFDIQTHGHIPSGGTILSVDELNFDRALVLLSLFHSARVYLDRELEAKGLQMQALSMRQAGTMPTTEVLGSIVSDLVHERVVIISARHAFQLQSSRSLRTPLHRVHVQLDDSKRALVLFEN